MTAPAGSLQAGVEGSTLSCLRWRRIGLSRRVAGAAAMQPQAARIPHLRQHWQPGPELRRSVAAGSTPG